MTTITYECDNCSGTVWGYLPKYESRDLCLACLDEVEPFWREKQMGIKVLDGRTDQPVTRRILKPDQVRIGDRLLGRGRGRVIAISRVDDMNLSGGVRLIFDYDIDPDRSTAEWESFDPDAVFVDVERADR